MKLCELLHERRYDFNIWAYARIDTVKEEYLGTLKKAGVNWLALGIESGNKVVRKDVVKGKFTEVNIRDLVEKIQGHGINVIANYIFGLPEDNHETMMRKRKNIGDHLLNQEKIDGQCFLGQEKYQLMVNLRTFVE